METFLFTFLSLLLNFGTVTAPNSVAAIQGTPPFSEGTQVEIEIRPGLGGTTCTLLPTGNDYSFVGSTSPSISVGQTGTITISLISDAVAEGPENVLVPLNCQDGSSPITHTATVSVIDSAGGNGDPHFKLVVPDKRDKTLKSVCFDVSSTNGNKINIFQDTKENITIYGILKDDYYMHIIQCKIDNQLFQVTVDQILFESGNFMEWNFESIKFHTTRRTVTVSLQDDLLHLTIPRSDNKYKENSFIVKKSTNVMVGRYLDIFINNLNSYKSASGLLGEAVNQEFEFYQSIQNSKKSSIKINHKIFQSELIERDGLECHLVDVNDILYPKTADQYISYD